MLCLLKGTIINYRGKNCLQSFAVIFLLLFCNVLYAQDYNQYHIDLENGLSSNNVYNLNFDHLGYMWICTDRGIIRYNGYELKTYTLTDGLSGNDIWHSTMDAKNRLWLQTVSNKLGYMANNKYHEIYLAGITTALYPKNIMSRGSGVLLLLPSQVDSKKASIYVERNDTLRETKHLFRYGLFIDSNTIIDIYPDSIYRYHIAENDTLKYIGVIPNKFSPEFYVSRSFAFGNNIGGYELYGNELIMQNIYTGVFKKLVLPGKANSGNRLYVLTSSINRAHILFSGNLYDIDSEMEIKRIQPLISFTHNAAIDEKIISFFTADRFWNNCITTRTSGIYINYETEHQLRRSIAIDLDDYEFIGDGGDGASYWWNYVKQTIQRIDQRGNVIITKYPSITDAIRIIPYDSTRSLLLTKSNLFLLNEKTQQIDFTAFPYFNIFENGKKTVWYSNFHPYSRNIALLNDSNLYITGAGIFKTTRRKDTLNFNMIYNDRFYNLEHDTVRKLLWVYSDYKIFVHPLDSTKKDVIIKDNQLKAFGIGNIEKIETDNSKEHIFLKDNSWLYYINFRTSTICSLFRNYNLQNAFFRVQDHTIILAGKFGLLFSKIKAPGLFSDPIVYPNIKNSLYHSVEDIAVMGRQVILKTDKGVYMQEIPADTSFKMTGDSLLKYKMIMNYRDTLYDLQKFHELNIIPGSTKISFDIINPEGNGTLAYRYFIDGSDTSWHDLNGSELKLPILDAEKTYTLSVEARDAVWRSDPVAITLYIVPNWWQTLRWRVIFWISGTIGVLALILAVILLTRYQTIRSGRKKQHMILLELRSIYAQINPHFIFNTLNTALYFIKKNKMSEAATHVSKFSALLRSYIESSRYRYISVADEIVNIRNYIELQQTRFEHAFSFDIITDDAVTLKGLYIPTLLLQPIVENAINHGLVPKGSGGHLVIGFHYNTTDQSIICTIEDNGIGREESKRLYSHEQTKKESYGSKLIEELIDIFNRYEQIKITIDYYDKQSPETGTRVTIKIKNPYDEQYIQLHHHR